MSRQKILITVKTYPTLSQKYDELVCTAGFTESGDWIRIYPVPFRKIPYHQQYKKYDWVELDIVKNKGDFRVESYRPKSAKEEIKVVGSIDTAQNWAKRKRIVLKNVEDDLSTLIASAKDRTHPISLAVFKPAKIKDFIIKPVNRNWSDEKLAALKQTNLFEKVTETEKRVVKKLPYKFSYSFTDALGKESTMMIEDWEIGQLYWNVLKSTGNEEDACNKVREKYFDEFTTQKDLYFFLGTTKANHFRSRNPFIIIGLFYPKKEPQLKFF